MHGKKKKPVNSQNRGIEMIITFTALGISIIILTFISDFFVSFIICLIGYIVHTIGHFSEHGESNIRKNIVFQFLIPIIVFIGWIAYIFMIINDPLKIYDFFLVSLVIGIVLTVIGFYIAYMAMELRKGFREQDELKLREYMGFLGIPYILD